VPLGRCCTTPTPILAETEGQLQRSGIASTVVRPPKLVNEPLTGQSAWRVDSIKPDGNR
jgi:hypothetical protein